MSIIYRHEFEIKVTSDTNTSASYLVVFLEIDNSVKLKTRPYDKRQVFDFPIGKSSRLAQDTISVSQSAVDLRDGKQEGFHETFEPKKLNLESESTQTSSEEVHVLDIQKKRRTNLKDVCASLNQTRHFLTDHRVISRHLVYYQDQDLAFCNNFKAGSTTMSRMFDFMNMYEKYSSPFDIGWEECSQRQKHPSVKNISEFNTNFSTSLKVLFVRDPYIRIFSAYMDKLFFPNIYYWIRLGIPIIKKYRDGASDKAVVCGHDVSFSETVKYIIDGYDSHSLNEHFVPYHGACRPCQIQYDIIGRTETSMDDLELIWNTLENSGTVKVQLPKIANRSDIENLDDKAGMIYKNRDRLSRCLSFYDVMKRAWRAFQMRGMIDCSITMPIKESDVNTTSLDRFKQILRQAYQQSNGELKSQCKRQAIADAYSTVLLEDLRILKQKLEADCELFGYDAEPNYIFNRS
ncbi:hypothetical protein ScPMuIL_011339 [Solemya velum]